MRRGIVMAVMMLAGPMVASGCAEQTAMYYDFRVNGDTLIVTIHNTPVGPQEAKIDVSPNPSTGQSVTGGGFTHKPPKSNLEFVINYARDAIPGGKLGDWRIKSVRMGTAIPAQAQAVGNDSPFYDFKAEGVRCTVTIHNIPIGTEVVKVDGSSLKPGVKIGGTYEHTAKDGTQFTVSYIRKELPGRRLGDWEIYNVKMLTADIPSRKK